MYNYGVVMYDINNWKELRNMNLFFSKLVSMIMSLVIFAVGLLPCFKDIKSIEILDVSYGESENQVYDIDFPGKAAGCAKEYGLLLYIHGGAWVGGDKSSYLSSIRSYQKFGIVCASMNYRFADENTNCFDMLDDIDSVIDSIIELSDEYGYKISRVMFAGSSAGAHLSMLYAYSRADKCPLEVVAVYSRSGPANFAEPDFLNNNALGDFNTVADWIKNVIGYSFSQDTLDEAMPYLEKASPVNYITENSVPTLMCHGKQDNLISFNNSITLDKKLTECSVKHDYLIFPNSGHSLDNDKIMSKLAEAMFFKYMFEYLI